MTLGTGNFLGGLAGGALGMIGNIFGVGMTNDQNKELVEQQNKLNIEQWNRENAYNAPIEQMRRLKAAGLNPNLIYGNSAGSLLSAPSPEMQAAHMQAPQVDPLTMAQIAKLNAETKNIDTSTDVAKSELPINEQKLLEIQQSIRESQQRINESAARIRNLDENTRKQESERLNIKFDQVMRSKEWKDSHSRINAEIRKLNAGAALDERQFKELCQTFVYRMTGLKLSNELTKQQISHYSRLIEKLGVDINLGIAQTDLANQEYDIKQVLQHWGNRTNDSDLSAAIMLLYNLFGRIF